MANDTGFDALYIVDNEYTDTAVQLLEKAARIQEIWDDFIKISRKIVGAQGSIEGSCARAYAEFIDVAEAYFSQKLLDSATESKKDMKTYIDMIDEADCALY